MKKTLALLCGLLLMAVTACTTHNNGDIDIWFGTWSVESIDGNTDYGTPLVFQFQSSVFAVRTTGDDFHTERADYGTWAEGEGTLDVNFPDPTVAYEHLLTDAGSLHFVIVSRGTKKVTLQAAFADRQVTYVLKKQP
ncbi:MAG: hypothetical protein IJ808_02470 [Muribaculaceae bacterium]|nr:hypothetical protein [Muribaculaceae bacterium]